MSTRAFVLLLTGMLLVGARTAEAQLAVQQPVVGITSVGTTVSVPDRGGAFLGGMGSAAYGRTMVGPFRARTTLGLQHARTGMSAHVWIHDPAEMDRLLLNQRTASPAPRLPDPYAEHAWRQLVRDAGSGAASPRNKTRTARGGLVTGNR